MLVLGTPGEAKATGKGGALGLPSSPLERRLRVEAARLGQLLGPLRRRFEECARHGEGHEGGGEKRGRVGVGEFEVASADGYQRGQRGGTRGQLVRQPP